MIAWLLTATVLCADSSLTTGKAAQIERDQQKASLEVAKKFGNRKPNELSGDERREMIRAQAEADREVLDKHGVDPKTWASYSAHQSRDEYAAQKAQVKELVEKEKQDEEARAKAAQQPTEITIQRGISDEKPVVLEEAKGGGQPIVEKGLPLDAKSDEDAAKEFDSAIPGEKGDKARPEKKAPARGKH